MLGSFRPLACGCGRAMGTCLLWELIVQPGSCRGRIVGGPVMGVSPQAWSRRGGGLGHQRGL